MKNERKSQKTPFFILTVTVVGICLLIGGLVVYATAMIRDEKRNMLQIGNLESRIEEVFDEPLSIQPDQMIEKEVKLKNSGTLTQFVRVMVQPTIKVRVAGEAIERLLPSKIGNEIIIDHTAAHWKLGEDGYYYYLDALQSGEETKALFEEVGLSSALSNEYQNSYFSLQIKVESVSNGSLGYREMWWSGQVPASGELFEIDQILTTKIDTD